MIVKAVALNPMELVCCLCKLPLIGFVNVRQFLKILCLELTSVFACVSIRVAEVPPRSSLKGFSHVLKYSGCK